MSCQQASRVSEDPYAFTEPAPLQPTNLFHSQLATLSPINKEQKQLPHIQQQLSQQKSRLNGVIAATGINGVIKNTIYHPSPQQKPQQTVTFTTANFSNQFQPQPHIPKFSKKVLPHKIQTTSSPSLVTQPPPALLTATSSGQIKYVKQLPQQPLVQQNKSNLVPDTKKYVINHSNSLTTATSSISPSAITLLPTVPTSKIRALHQQQPTQNKIFINSSNLTSNNTISNSCNNSINNKILKCEQSTIPSLHTALPTINTIKTAAATATARRTLNQQNISKLVDNHQQPPQQQHCSVIINNNGNNGKGNVEIVNNKNTTFVIPKQEDGDAVNTIITAKKAVGGAGNAKPAPSGKRAKRSYSHSSHHETIQRISGKELPTATSKTKIKAPGAIAIPNNREWHAPDSFIYDYTGPGSADADQLELSACTQNCWFIESSSQASSTNPSSSASLIQNVLLSKKTGPSDSLNINNSINNNLNSDSDTYFLIKLTRDQRLQLKRSNLRRKAVQYWNGQNLRNSLFAKRRLLCIFKVLTKLQQQHDITTESYNQNRGNIAPSNVTQEQQKCTLANCNQKALVLTAYCYQHITNNTEQRLFHPCTAKFSDNTQCRVPVFDISHELPLCREHAWKRDNYNKMLQELKPKKPPRKKPKPSAMTRPPKRNKKKKKMQQQKLLSSSNTNTQHPYKIQQQPEHEEPLLPPPHYTTIYNNYHPSNNKITEIVQINNSSSIHHNHDDEDILAFNDHHLNNGILSSSATQDLLSICENSSAYASSEDTGVGGLSESELIAVHDVIEEIPFEIENHELTNVLNQIPADAFHELFAEQQNGPFQPTQEEQEDLERALEAVDEHVKSLEQMTEESTNFLGDFLDNVDDDMLDSTDICSDQMLQSPNTLDLRGLVHT